MLPANELQKKLDVQAINGIRTAFKGKKILIKTLQEAHQDMMLMYGDIPSDFWDAIPRLNELGYKAIIVVDLFQKFNTEYRQGHTINIPSYNNLYIRNNQGWVTGSIQVPQNNPIYIPARNETYLYTGCVSKLLLMDDLLKHDLSHKAIVTYQIYKRYQGGAVEKVLENIVKASMKSLFTGKKK